MSHSMVFGGALFGLFAVYVFVVNNAAVKGTEIRDLERRITQLEESVEDQSLHEARLRSLIDPSEGGALAAVAPEEVRIVAVATEIPAVVAVAPSEDAADEEVHEDSDADIDVETTKSAGDEAKLVAIAQ